LATLYSLEWGVSYHSKGLVHCVLNITMRVGRKIMGIGSGRSSSQYSKSGSVDRRSIYQMSFCLDILVVACACVMLLSFYLRCGDCCLVFIIIFWLSWTRAFLLNKVWFKNMHSCFMWYLCYWHFVQLALFVLSITVWKILHSGGGWGESGQVTVHSTVWGCQTPWKENHPCQLRSKLGNNAWHSRRGEWALQEHGNSDTTVHTSS
jgi:hypothetical protein